MTFNRTATLMVLAVLLAGATRADAGTLTLMWDPSTDTQVAGYVVYVGTKSGVHTESFDVGNGTWFVYRDAVPGQRYYLAVASYAPGPVLGAKSAEVSGYSDAPPTLINPGNQTHRVGDPVLLQLDGQDPYGEAVTFSAIGLPPGLQIVPSTGHISGAGKTAGVFPVTASVHDGVLSHAQSFTWTMQAATDTQAPAVLVTTPSAAASFTSTLGSLTLAGTSSDNVGVTTVTWATDGGASGTASGTSAWTAAGIPLKAGANTIAVQARDAAGNQGAATVTVSYVDGVAPVVAITAPTAAATFATSAPSIALGGTAADAFAVTGVTWSNDRGGSGTASGTTSWTVAGVALQPGMNVITVMARDAAGNTSNSVLTVVRSDNEAPATQLVAPTSHGTFSTTNSTVTLAGTARDNVGVTAVRWSTDGGASGVATGTTDWNTGAIPLAPGDTRIVVTAWDAAGNQAGVVLTVSMTAPVEPVSVKITSPVGTDAGGVSAASYNSPSAVISMAGEAIGGQQIAEVVWTNDRGGSGLATGQTTWTIPAVALQQGVNVVRVTARCATGATATSSLIVVYDAPDLVAPAVSITSPTKGAKHTTNSATVLLAGVAVDNTAVTMVTWMNSRGGSGMADGTSVWTTDVPLLEGDNVLTITAHDAAGNTARAVLTVSRKSSTGKGK